MTATSVEYMSDLIRRPKSVKPLASSMASGTEMVALRKVPSMGAGSMGRIPAGVTAWGGADRSGSISTSVKSTVASMLCSTLASCSSVSSGAAETFLHGSISGLAYGLFSVRLSTELLLPGRDGCSFLYGMHVLHLRPRRGGLLFFCACLHAEDKLSLC